MKILPANRSELVEAALGERDFDLVIRNVKMVNVFSGEVYPAEIGIYDGFIAHINADPDNIKQEKEILKGKEIYDGKGKYIIPGFVDSHIHIESTMMTPANFMKAVLPLGTTTVITDPHEVANVMGLDGVKYMLEASENLSMRQYVLAPSCVPAMPGFETSGAKFGAEEISEILSWDRVLGLAEVMDFPGVISNSKRMREIIDVVEKSNGFLQGHIMGTNGRALSAYICGGPISDHETSDYNDVRERVRFGMYIDAKASTYVDNASHIISAVKDLPFLLPNLTLCTDDREPDGILEQGHMNHVVNTAIKAGLDPVKAITCATLHGAREVNIENLGAIAPGYVADLVILPSLTDIKPSAVFFNGKLAAEDGRLILDIPEKNYSIESINTVYLDVPNEEKFRIAAPIQNGTVKTRVIKQDGMSFSDFVIEELSVKNGYLDISHDKNLKYIAVLNRHKGNNNYSIGVIRNFPTMSGTVASTFAHDSHNLVIVYSKPEEAVLAAKELIECGGGLICVKDKEILGKLELPLFGLISTLECKELALKHRKVTEAAMKLTNNSPINPLMNAAVLPLPVVPWGRITDKGLFSLKELKFLPLFVEQ